MGVEHEPVGEEELRPLVEILTGRFIQRRDPYARQLADGRYVAVHRPLRPEHLLAHLRGEMTLGTYLLDAESRGRFLVLDADDAPNWRRLQALAGALAVQGAAGYLEPSRRGGHLWYFLAEPLAGKAIRAFGAGLLAFYHIEGVELFPKQDRVRGGPGSLIRLPFGVHRAAGRRYSFYDPSGQPIAPTLREQIRILETPQTLPEAVLSYFSSLSPSRPGKGAPGPAEKPRDPILPAGGEVSLAERIKAAISVRQFVLRFVALSPAGRGLCPFHDDRRESFSVNDAEGYWHCFACGVGGSAIDFWMRWRQCDFPAAVRELAPMLL